MSNSVIVITAISWNGEHTVNTIHKVVPAAQKETVEKYVKFMNSDAGPYSTKYEWEEFAMESLPQVETFYARQDTWGDYCLVANDGRVVLSVLKGPFDETIFQTAVKAYRTELSASNRNHVLIVEIPGVNADEY